DSEASKIEVSSSRTGGTKGPTRTFGYPHDPTKALGGEAPKRFVVRRSRRSTNQDRTLSRYGQIVSRQRLMSPWQTRQEISRRTSARVSWTPSSGRDGPDEDGRARVTQWGPSASGRASGPAGVAREPA